MNAQMGNRNKKEQETIRHMVRERLKARVVAAKEPSVANHLDDDTISAFFEARLGEAESAPVIAHLVSCSICRHATAQLAQFDSDVSATTLPPAGDETPTSLRQWFDDFRAGFGPTAEEVFAYQNPPEVSEEASKSTDEASGGDDEAGDEGKTDPRNHTKK